MPQRKEHYRVSAVPSWLLVLLRLRDIFCMPALFSLCTGIPPVPIYFLSHTDIVWAVPVFSPHQARWYSWSSHTTKKLKIMNNPLSNLQLDVWYKVLIVICTIVFLSTAGGLLPKLPTSSALLISLGGIFFCCGEWKNHPRYTVVEYVMGQQFLGTGFKRAFSITGTILCLIGAYLLYKGIMPLL